jgi:glucose-6-phosphate 1-dehydrogenase
MQSQQSNKPKSISIPPTVLTIFGATGDLSLRYLLPSLIHMDSLGLIPDGFRLVATGRRPLTARSLLLLLKEKSPVVFEEKQLRRFERLLEYYQGDLEDGQSFAGLSKIIADGSGKKHSCYNRLYYFSTAPSYFGPTAEILKQHNLLSSCRVHKRSVRILVEKPFGHDLQSAKKLNQQLLRFFSEDQIYRIDHYLGKETVQNLLVARFANDLFEPMWDRDFIDRVEITVTETVGAGNRAAFYDQTGAVRDLIQNHMLQMLALIAMEPPKDLTATAIRQQKVRVLKSLAPFTKKNIRANVVRGQYTEYQAEVGKKTDTETFVALKTFVNNKRWKGVPFYLRTGKRLDKRVTEIAIHFKKRSSLFGSQRSANILKFRIQPDESVHMQINNKIPGFGIELHTGSLDFGYKTAFLTEIPPAYERLFLDFIQGDQRLFISKAEIEAAWEFADSLLLSWNKGNAPIKKYPSGSTGPHLIDWHE